MNKSFLFGINVSGENEKEIIDKLKKIKSYLSRQRIIFYGAKESIEVKL